MSVMGEVIGIAQKNNPQVYWLISIHAYGGHWPRFIQSNLHTHTHTYSQLASQLYKVQLHNLELLCYKLKHFLCLVIYCVLLYSVCLIVIVLCLFSCHCIVFVQCYCIVFVQMSLYYVCLVIIVLCLFICYCIAIVFCVLYCVGSHIVQAVQPFVLPFFGN